MIGIIGAMEQEVEAIKMYMSITKTTNIIDCVFYEGTIANKEVVLLQGGIGKVNAAICTTLLLTNYVIDYVINIGSAGGLNLSQEVGDIIISDEVIHHDVDITAFGREKGEIPGLPKSFKADAELIKKARNSITKLGMKASIGVIVSGDQFIAEDSHVLHIKEFFPNAQCAEMEAAAVAQTCYKFNTKFIITRSLSDVFGKGDSSIQFDEYLKKASQSSAKMCISLIES